ncbi:hypothetical protein [Advenella sp. S44]|nr:hypothetical protein [Advenella sp. S44]
MMGYEIRQTILQTFVPAAQADSKQKRQAMPVFWKKGPASCMPG